MVRNQESKFYKLKKALYGLKQVSQAWNKRIYDFLKEVDFNQYVSKHSVYVKTDTSKKVIVLCLYVDDLLITGINEECISKFKSELMKYFEMIDLALM